MNARSTIEVTKKAATVALAGGLAGAGMAAISATPAFADEEGSSRCLGWLQGGSGSPFVSAIIGAKINNNSGTGVDVIGSMHATSDAACTESSPRLAGELSVIVKVFRLGGHFCGSSSEALNALGSATALASVHVNIPAGNPNCTSGQYYAEAYGKRKFPWNGQWSDVNVHTSCGSHSITCTANNTVFAPTNN